jgi:hypothetical protein
MGERGRVAVQTINCCKKRPNKTTMAGAESTVNTAQLTPGQHPHVVVRDGEVQIVDFIETDPYVHRVLTESADPEEATHALLRIGAQATLIAGADLDAQVVERRFEGMTRNFDSSLSTAVSRISQVSSELVDGETGALTQLLNQTRTGLKALLDDTFDPDSKSSAITKIDTAFDNTVQQLDHKREILETVKEVARDQGRQLQELAPP